MKLLRKALFMIFVIKIIQSQQPEPKKKLTKCVRELIESYNLNSYTKPRKINLYICPNVKTSCCSAYDQFMMYQNWRNSVKPRLLKYYKGIEDKILHTTLLTTEIMKMDLKTMLDEIKTTDKEKNKLIVIYSEIKRSGILGNLERAMPILRDNTQFMLDVRSSFYCLICDFANHSYIDFKNKQLEITESSCSMIAENTINFSYMLNVMIAPILMKFSEITSAFSLGEKQPFVKIKQFKKILRASRKCGMAFKNGQQLGSACKEYCKYYNINANSPVIEGYQQFFNDMMNVFTKFIQDHAHPVLENDRILSLQKTTSRLTKERHLEVFFTQEELNRVKDPYEESVTDPEYTDYVLNKMFNFQDKYEKNRKHGYVNFVRSKLHYFDVEFDFDAGDNQLFKTSTTKLVDLENYITKIGAEVGIDIERHTESCNIETTMRDLVSHLKLKTKYKITYEKLDPTLLSQVNDIRNDDIKHYHRDNFLFFKDFSLDLKSAEIMGNMKASKKLARKQGYDFKKKQ